MKSQIQITEEEQKAIVEYLSGAFSESEAQILHHWLAKSESNRLLFDQFAAIWHSSYHKTIHEKIDAKQAWADLQNQIGIQNKKAKNINWKEILRIAAVFMVALFLGGLSYNFIDWGKGNNPEPLYVEYFSPLGSRSFVQLADGSKVWLNSGSTLKYQNSFGTNNRELLLTGEAYFEVEKNKDLPFVVKTSEIDIIALGTQFNVKAYSEEKTIETTLIEGSVKLESKTVKLADNLVLKPNEKAVFTKKNQERELKLLNDQQKESSEAPIVQAKPKLEIIQSVEPKPIISWKEQRWVINNEKLGNLAVKLERRYDVNFIFDNEVLEEYSFRGTLEDETLEQIMEAIKFSAPIKYIIDKKTVYVMADGKKMEKFKNLMIK